MTGRGVQPLTWRRRMITWLRWAMVPVMFTVLWWMFNRVGWTIIGHTMTRVGWRGASLLLAIALLETASYARAMQMAGPEQPLGLGAALTCNSAGSVVNALVPFAAGELVKGVLLSRHVGALQAVNTIITWNYIRGVSGPLVIITAAIAGLSLGVDIDTWKQLTLMAAALMTIVPFALIKLLIHHQALERSLSVLRRIGVARQKPGDFSHTAIEMEHRLDKLATRWPAQFRRLVGYQIAGRTLSWVMIVAIVELVGVDADPGVVCLIFACFHMSMYLFILLPVRAGGLTGMGYGIFSILGLDPGLGVAVGLVFDLCNIAGNGVLAPWALLYPVDR